LEQNQVSRKGLHPLHANAGAIIPKLGKAKQFVQQHKGRWNPVERRTGGNITWQSLVASFYGGRISTNRSYKRFLCR